MLLCSHHCTHPPFLACPLRYHRLLPSRRDRDLSPYLLGHLVFHIPAKEPNSKPDLAAYPARNATLNKFVDPT